MPRGAANQDVEVGMAKSLMTLCVVLGISNVPAYAGWMSSDAGQMPPNAFVAGQSRDGQRIHVCRAQFEGGVHPGVIGPSSQCDITHRGSGYSIPTYEVLIDNGYSWATVYNGEIPFDALEAGTGPQGTTIYICRGDINTQWYTGTIRQTDAGCSIPLDGSETTAPWYEVLVGN